MNKTENNSNDELLQYLKGRLSVAKKFTQKLINEVNLAKIDYKGLNNYEKNSTIDQNIRNKKRYLFNSRYIFRTVQSNHASLTQNTPELISNPLGSTDADKVKLIEGMYAYLKGVAGIDEAWDKSAMKFLLNGFVSYHAEYVVISEGDKILLDAKGNPLMDKLGNPLKTPNIVFDDPVLKVDNPKRTYFAPDSEYSNDCKKVPYIIREIYMDVDEVNEKYGVEIQPGYLTDIGEDESKLSENEKESVSKGKVYFYYGKVPKKYIGGGSGSYCLVFTENKILNAQESDLNSSIARCFTDEDEEEFFGFGYPFILRDEQKEMSIIRGQMTRYRDKFSAMKTIVSAKDKTLDKRSIKSSEDEVLAVHDTTFAPYYLVPPQMPSALISDYQTSQSDAQSTSGTLDISKGAQNTNTVQTATGQQLFAQSMEKQIEKAKRQLGRAFKVAIINLFKLARDNWPDDKAIAVLDPETEEQIQITKESLNNIDFEKDIEFTLDNISLNRDIQSQRVIAMYDKTKDDPMFNQIKIRVMLLRDGFNKKDAKSYLSPQNNQESLSQRPGEYSGTDDMENNQATLGDQLAPQPY